MKEIDLDIHFDTLFHKIKASTFINMEALGGEIPFYISTYNPTLELAVDRYISSLRNRLNTAGVDVHTIDLYDMACSILGNRRILDRLIEKENALNKSQYLKALAGPLDPEKYINPFIATEVEKINPMILFIKGIGSVYPFIRAESLLNNLQAAVKSIPVVLFFPGQYHENKLYLFKGDHTSGIKEPYYRAFNLNDFKV